MEKSRNTPTSEKHEVNGKKKTNQEKKTRSDTTAYSGSTTEEPLESFIIVGKSVNFGKTKSRESSYRLHECESQVAINLLPENQSLKSYKPLQSVQITTSNTSFVSAKSDCSSDGLPKTEEAFKDTSKSQVIPQEKKLTGYDSTKSTEVDETIKNIDDCKLHSSEKKNSVKEQKVKDPNQISECCKVKESLIQENRSLSCQVNLLNRQIQSMYKLIGNKSRNSVDLSEFACCKNKTADLETLIINFKEENKGLKRKMEELNFNLECKEKEISHKNRELLDYKNRSTLEICKLLNQIDYLQKEAKSQSQILEDKILETQNLMDNEIVSITQRLEEQYQGDLKQAIEKFHCDFERLAELPKSAIEKLLQICEPSQIDLIAFQKEWDKQQTNLETKIASMQHNHNIEVMQMKDSYESKIVLLKTQIESLATQLKERKDILDILKSELVVYKNNSSMDLLASSSREGDISALKELYTAEIFSQKQVHKLQLDIFEEKVKNLSEEILYHAKNEEIHLRELDNAKKMAQTFREKYEQLVFECEGKIEKDIKVEPTESSEKQELDNVFTEFKNLIQSLKKSEEGNEERILKLQISHDDKLSCYEQDMEKFKTKLYVLEKAQKAQAKLDETIHELIQSLGINYTKTIEALSTSHMKELNLKQLEMYSIEKRYLEELTLVKSTHEKEMVELNGKIKLLEESKTSLEKELDTLKKGKNYEEILELKIKNQEMSSELIKSEGMIAIKEETEQALMDRIKNLEILLKNKEESCRKELNNILAKYLEVEVLAAAKDDLTKELEETINNSEKLLVKSCGNINKLYKLCSLLGDHMEKVSTSWPDDGGDFKNDSEFFNKYSLAKASSELLESQVLNCIEKIQHLDDLYSSKQTQLKVNDSPVSEELKNFEVELNEIKMQNKILESERTNILAENNRLKKELKNLSEALTVKEKMISKVNSSQINLSRLIEKWEEERKKSEVLEEEKRQILIREESVTVEKNELLERNKILEENIIEQKHQIDHLTTELANIKEPKGDEVFSISLQQVRVLYQEEQETISDMERTPSTSTIACQAEPPVDSFSDGKLIQHIEDLRIINEELKLENQHLKTELKSKRSEREVVEVEKTKSFLDDEMILKFSKTQSELSEVLHDRNELLVTVESLKKERDFLREENESLKEENYTMQANSVAKLKIFAERAGCSSSEDSGIAECRMTEMTSEIGKLSNYIKALSNKLDEMRANNESLLKESHKYLRHNQNLVNELEEAWTQRYEIEDQLAKVRKENVQLNIHRRQLEETNQRISNLVAEGKPSVLSWIKVHETVESIVDEVLALKTSFSDSDSGSETSIALNAPKTASELKLMAETLHATLQNKTVLCDELMIQKETLEKELKELEELLKQNDFRILAQKNLTSKFNRDLGVKKGREEFQTKQPVSCSIENNPSLEIKEGMHLMTLNLLKKHLEDQVELEEVHFRENLELEIEGLKKEMQKEENNSLENKNSAELVQSRTQDLVLIEMKYEQEILELTKQFEEEIEKLKNLLVEDIKSENFEAIKEKFLMEIEKTKSYFERKWLELEKRYQRVYSNQNFNSATNVNSEKILVEASKFSQNKEESEIIDRSNYNYFLKHIFKKHTEELKLLKTLYQEGLSELQKNQVKELEKLKSIVLNMKESMTLALKKENIEEWQGKVEKEHQLALSEFQRQYEEKLESEKKKLNDFIEEMKKKHEKEIFDMEEFWTEKLSDCETKCAILKATVEKRIDNKNQRDEKFKTTLENDSYRKQNSFSYISYLNQGNFEERICRSCLLRDYYKRMEVKTDDDKLEILRERDALRDSVSSLRFIITKLLSFIGQSRAEISNISEGDFDNEETLYKSIQTDLIPNTADLSVSCCSVPSPMNLTTIIQEINDISLLNSSDQVRFELECCLKQLNKDATSILALSCPQTSNQNLFNLMNKLEREKNLLENKVCNVEKIQEEMKKEIDITKEKLAQWERNFEVVSEGYGEEVIEPKKFVSLTDFKEKIKLFLEDQPHEINLLEEICKEGDRLQEEWKREKFDLQQQIDAADKQVHSLKKFLEEQAVEREQEREAFDQEISQLKENLKAKERDSLLQSRSNREGERLIELDDKSILESELRELSGRLNETEKNKSSVEAEFQNAVKKIWSLREVIQDLEIQLAEMSEKESILKKKGDKLENLAEEQAKTIRDLKEELETCKKQNDLTYSEHIKNLENELINLRRLVDQINPETFSRFKSNLREIERILMRKTKDLEQLHVSSANASCSSPSEDVSIRDQLDATRCSTPDEMCSNVEPENVFVPLEEIDRIHEKLARHNRAEEVAMKCIRDLKMQIRNNRKNFEEIQTERDVLLEKVDVYLKENSSLKIRLEEQRCNAGLLQKRLNASLESQISRLEVDVEKLNKLCDEKDKQLKDMKEILENTTKALQVKEAEVLNKSKEENLLISTLKTDLGNAINENQKLMENLEKMKRKDKEKLKMPALIDSIIEEKNAEIDRLEGMITKLSNENSLLLASKNSESNSKNNDKRVKFSEPDSFGECISSISPLNPSIMRNCSNTFSDVKVSPYRIQQSFQCSSKLESVSSIAHLQLSPRGTDLSLNWKTSSPILFEEQDLKVRPNPSFGKSENDCLKMLEESKLQSELGAKQREISELNLEIDILKRQLVEVNQQLATVKTESKEIQNDLISKDEEIRKLKNNEKSLLITVESLKKNHAEEVEDLQNKLSFEHGKVEKVYEEIKALEVKKVEIEEAFFSLKEDYNEKIHKEQKMVDDLMNQIKDLENKNENLVKFKKEIVQQFNQTFQKLTEELSNLKVEKEELLTKCSELQNLNKNFANAEVQVEKVHEPCELCQKNLSFDFPNIEGELNQIFLQLKSEFEKMSEGIIEKDFNKTLAFSYAIAVKRLLSYILNSFNDLCQELETHRKKIMECSVDDLAVKVQNELVLSAKLDNKLLSSINGFSQKDTTPQTEISNNCVKALAGGDGLAIHSLVSEENETRCKELEKKVSDLETEKKALNEKIIELQKNSKSITQIENSKELEKNQRIIEERKRCNEDAKIMELLRINLERSLAEIKLKEKDLMKEKQQRVALEKKIQNLKQNLPCDIESKKILDLREQIENLKEKIVSLNQDLEEEKGKNQELKLLLEKSMMERMSEKNAQRLLENDLELLKEQKENFKKELVNVRKLLNSRNFEIGLLKRKINLQEIDIKAFNLSNDYQLQTTSGTSSVINVPSRIDDLSLKGFSNDCIFTGSEISSSVLDTMKKLNSCIQRQVKDSSSMGEALLYLSQETEQMKEMIKKLEESSESKISNETLIADLDMEKRLWALEKGSLLMEIDTLKRENEILKRDWLDTCKNYDILKTENAKLRPPNENTNLIETGVFRDRILHLTRKFMRAESFRKALAWQKNYLMITLREHKQSEEEAWRKIGGKKKDRRKSAQKRFNKFRVVGLVIIATFRIRYVFKRWQHHSWNIMPSGPLHRNHCVPLASVLNIYNEPVNPLSYQTQNIIRPPTKILRTPPSRDVGPQTYSLDVRRISDDLDTFSCLREKIGAANI